jgi:hypothetical protein
VCAATLSVVTPADPLNVCEDEVFSVNAFACGLETQMCSPVIALVMVGSVALPLALVYVMT